MLRAALGAALFKILPGRVQADTSFGRVNPPQATPTLRVTSVDARSTELVSLLQGKVTALQLMFTGCSATCPIQGAVFSEVQAQLSGAAAHFQLLSVSIDPMGDDPKALRAWLRRFGAQPTRWTAALATPEDLDRLLDFLRGRARGADRHTPQVYLFDRRARLFFRTADLPPAGLVVSGMQHIARQG